MHIEYYYVSNIGKRRKKNQDNLICNEEILPLIHENIEIKKATSDSFQNIFGVFDGLGGEKEGEMASFITAKTFLNNKEKCDSLDNIEDICRIANLEICDYMDEKDIDYMGTTAAVLGIINEKVLLVNLGDSKIYKIANNTIEQISKDHVDEIVKIQKPALYQYIGIRPEELLIEPYRNKYDYKKNDCYIISSDGLTDMVAKEKILEILKNEPKELVASSLLNEALNNGGRDNITFILIYLR